MASKDRPDELHRIVLILGVIIRARPDVNDSIFAGIQRSSFTANLLRYKRCVLTLGVQRFTA